MDTKTRPPPSPPRTGGKTPKPPNLVKPDYRPPPPPPKSDRGVPEIGAIRVEVTLSNPADRSRSWTGPLLVDTGATNSVVPRPILGTIGVVPEDRKTYELADGTVVQMDVATARIEFMGELTAGLVVFGSTDAEPLLGATAMESVGIEVCPRNQQLSKRSAVRLKAARASLPC